MEQCTTVLSDPAIRLPDCGKVVVLSNPSREKVHRVRFDGCVVQNQKAVDYLVSVGNERSLLVELKGRDVEHAIDQISESAHYLKQNYAHYQPDLGLIFCKQVPSGSSTINRKRERLYKDHGIDLRISSSKSKFCLKRLCFE